MPQATGANAQMIYQAEAAYGVTNPSPDAIMLPILSESLSQKRSLPMRDAAMYLAVKSVAAAVLARGHLP